MYLSKQPKRWKQSFCIMLSIILIVSSLSFVTVTDKAQAASTTPELIVDYEFKDPGSGSGLPMDKKGNSVLTEVSGTHNGKTYGNTTKAYGTDSTGDYWGWTTNTNRGGGFTLDIDPTNFVGKDIEKSYTISVRFSYDSFNSSWTKIIDYKNKTADTGFYFTGNKKLKFYDIGNEGSTAVNTNSIVDIIATRDVATNKFTAYMVVNGVLQKEIEVNDTNGQAIPILIDEKIRFGFFHDDYASGGAEKTVGGKVYSIKFWDGALAPANVLEVTATKGEAEGSTKFELPVPQTSGNIFKAKISDGLLPYPMPGDPLPTGVQDYVSDTDLLNVDGNKNKYVGIYEVDSDGQIVGFRLITLTDNEIQANKQALRDKKDEIELENLEETKYSSESWKDLQDKLEEATAVLDNPLATQAEVDQALSDLTSAYEALQEIAGINKAALQAKVDEAAGLTEAAYTAETWAAYQEELAKAQAVLVNTNATQAEVDQALADLTSAYEALQEVAGIDKAALQAKVDEAAGLTEAVYTAETWAAYQEELAKAQAVLINANATQAEVDQALADLTSAQEALQEIAGINKAALQAKVDEATGLTEAAYTAETWAAYQEELAKAQAVLVNTNATQAEVDQALADLTSAQEALQEVAGINKAALQAKVDEATGLTEAVYTAETWAAYQEELAKAQAVLVNTNATQAEVDQALANLMAARNALRPVLATPVLNSLVPSTGALSPSFSSEVTNYTMYVDYSTSQISFLATPKNPSALVTMTVNGQVVTNGIVPLAIGANTVVITVQDGTGFKQYMITVYRANDNSSGGGTWTPDPTPPTTNPGTTTTKIKVELEIDGDNPLEKTAVEIERTKHANGEITDFVAITEENVKEAVEKAKQIGNNIARIVIPDVNDEVDKVTVEIPKQSLQTLRENGLSLEISTENGHIAIPQSSMEGIDDSFYFRLVPVKKESERQAIEERAKVEQVVRETLQSNDVSVIARPMTIETNMPSRPVQVTLPLKGVNVPTSSAEREAFLAQLAVFIEHSDGEKKVVFPEVVTMAKGELGLRFTVEKFSTFTIIQFEKPEVSEHEAYIKGFPNGTFGPDKNVTRAQVAIMMARILGYTEGQTVNKAPFKDVAKDHSAAGAIAFVKEQGIMNGDNKGNFHANANITRAEMAAVAANFKQLSVEEGAAITFKDTKDHWAQWIIEANRAAGIINGLENGSFAPNAALTRAQAVVMMNRMFERGPLHGVTKPSFPDVKAKHWAFKEIEEAANSHAYIIDEDGKEQLSK